MTIARILIVVLTTACATTASAVFLPVQQDASAKKGQLSASTGKAKSLPVSAAGAAFVQFDVGDLPATIDSNDVIAARLVFFVNKTSLPGELTVHVVTQEWSEATAATSPAFDTEPLASIAAAQVAAKRFFVVDVTEAVIAWLDGSVANNGFAIATDAAQFALASKEGAAGGHPAELEIVTTPGFSENGVGPLVFDDDNVGIGTSTPAFPLDVAGTIRADTLVGALDGANLIDNSVPACKLDAGIGVWSASGGNVFRSAGRVGIGTSTPVEELDVEGRIQADDVQLVTGASAGRFLVSNAAGVASWTNAVRTENNRIGIGLDDGVPAARLHVADGSTFTTTFVRTMLLEDPGNLDVALRVSGASDARVLFERPILENGAEIRTNDAGLFTIGRFRFNEPGSSSTSFQLFLDLASGNFGVGQVPTTNDLEVDGTASKTAAGDWLANSDRRIKTDVRGISDARATVMKLRPVVFRYSDEWRARHPEIEDRDHRNFIAQEYREVFPDAVQGSGEYLDGDPAEILQLDTHDAQMVTIKAVQELIAENAALQEQIDVLVERLDRLEAARR